MENLEDWWILLETFKDFEGDLWRLPKTFENLDTSNKTLVKRNTTETEALS